MQGRERAGRQLLDAQALVGHLVPAGSMFAFLAGHRQESQLAGAIRRVGRVVPGAAEQIAEVCTGHDYTQPGKPRIDWDDPAAKDALVSALVTDTNALVAALNDQELDEQAASAVGLLALVAGQDVGPAEGSDGTDGRWRIARKVAEDRVISVHDPQARHTRKSPEARRDGYRAHVVACPETGIITGERLTKACGDDNSDAAVAGQFLAGQAASGGPACEWYGDSAYGTGDLRAAISQARQTAVIKPGPLQPAVAGGFTTDDFTVDEAAATVTCPAGVTRRITARRAVIFGAACRGCPLRARCTTAQDGRTLRLHPHDAILRAARATWAAQPALREDYAYRQVLADFRPPVPVPALARVTARWPTGVFSMYDVPFSGEAPSWTVAVVPTGPVCLK